MPNWCKNNLKILGDELEVKRCVKLIQNDKGEMTFDKAVPMPLPLKSTTSPSQKKNKHLIDAYGTDNWYNWSIKNWGVKWDACESEFNPDDDITVTFETPWGPPVEFLQKLSLEFPDLDFELQFADEFFGQYPLGELYFKNGGVSECSGPIEGSKKAEAFADSVWMVMWVTDWTALKPIEEEE